MNSIAIPGTSKYQDTIFGKAKSIWKLCKTNIETTDSAGNVVSADNNIISENTEPAGIVAACENVQESCCEPSLAKEIQVLRKGVTYLIYLGQAGYIIKSASGSLIGIDLYLSNCLERYDGFKRLMPCILKPEETALDYVVASHAHYDHFDVDAMPGIMANGRTKLFASKNCAAEVERLGIRQDAVTYIERGRTYAAGDAQITCVFCDHGKAAPDAVGLIISVDGKKLYFAGDTRLRTDEAEKLLKLGPFNVMVAPINGAFGNLNEDEMVTLCSVIRPNLAIPSHYWCFAEHGGNPGLFIKIIKERLPEQKYMLMAQGEIYKLCAE
ncbi:MAG: MBL fold metallo-hydrolase [Eubacteriales bacterium]|nr:MBL fold metallo-hydrolase [Eubacteriales bacterium]